MDDNLNKEKYNQLGFNLLLDKIQNNQNYSIKCKVFEEYEDKNLGVIFLTLYKNGEKSSKFIRISDTFNLKNEEISFELVDLKMRIFKGEFYFLIEKYRCEKPITDSAEYQFNSIKIYDSIEEIEKKENHLCSFKLKAKELLSETKKFDFRDSKGKNINIEGINNYKFEHGKIYCFNGFLYNISNNELESTIISDIQEYSFNCEKIFNLNEINKCRNNGLVNFRGKVKEFNISEKTLNVENSEKMIFKIYVNFNLLKKISVDNECIFFNFFKIKDNQFNFSNLSDIKVIEETFIEFNFLDFDEIKEKYYNRIKINDQYYEINKKSRKILITNNNELNIFLQEIFYEKLENEEIKKTFKFCLELNKGKNNHVDSLLGNGGFCYQFYIYSYNEEDLPLNIPIKINKNDIIYQQNADKNENKLMERFSIINVPEQNIKNIFDISKNDNKIDSIYDWKYMISINNKKEKDFKKFEKININNKKQNIKIPENIQKPMEKIINICNNNSSASPLDGIDYEEFNIIIAPILKIFENFEEYEFENNKEDYENIQNILLIILYYYSEEFGKYFIIFIKNYQMLLNYIINLEYIDRIKILISFVIKTLRNIKNFDNHNKIISYNWLNLINLDDEETYKKYPFIKNAFDIFYNIIDNLTEDCLFFQKIQQFNSRIYKEVISGENMPSGSILNLNDIKLELFKNINRFLFLSEKKEKDCDVFETHDDKSLLVTINLFSFLDNKYNMIEGKNYNNSTCVILFSLFNECFGYQNKKINNEKKDKKDIGKLFEKIIFGEVINLKSLIKNNNLEKLLESKLYIEKTFDKLRKIYLNYEKKENNEDEKQESKNKPILMYHDLFRIYGNITDEQKELLKDDENYQRFLKLYEKRKNPKFVLPEFIKKSNK